MELLVFFIFSLLKKCCQGEHPLTRHAVEVSGQQRGGLCPSPPYPQLFTQAIPQLRPSFLFLL